MERQRTVLLWSSSGLLRATTTAVAVFVDFLRRATKDVQGKCVMKGTRCLLPPSLMIIGYEIVVLSVTCCYRTAGRDCWGSRKDLAQPQASTRGGASQPV
ncbi:hypothetical protein EDD18DRAFT_156024 [Armillaria luteobubalina]|uniref:Uncharacterized protein n=1 Tax=Armillaria luteobubalina TaxID=153913 RepID=A0AA39Q742_9AGAR|nr:hypothetical protein EDD18DRAFT_156024 [Armillaria luteobubalina]